MIRNFFTALIFFVLICSLTPIALAKENSFTSIVNPVRGADFWELKNQTVEEAFLGEATILDKYKASATWLLRFDAFDNPKIIDSLKSRSSDEIGLFLEITPTWTKTSGVNYRASNSWHNAGSAFLSGYELAEREKLIDSAFEKFKNVFGNYPKTVGAWWVDANSISYMYEKYGIDSALIVADQYTTDNYQIWGQFWSTPYYPAKNNALHPAQSINNRIPVVMIQWAARDPVNAYGNSVTESTFSVQANDYIDYHNLNIGYFEKLVNIYTEPSFNQFGFLVVGLENSYEWAKYQNEYDNQIKTLAHKRDVDGLSLLTISSFADWYKKTYPSISASHVIAADDPLGSYKKTVWFMNPYYRAGFFINAEGAVFRDIRQYIDGQEELCFKKRCDVLNFAIFATRVLDEVSFGHKWVIDEGKISDFKVSKMGDRVVITYLNEAGRARRIELLERDISVDGKISSIDGAILEVTKQELEQERISPEIEIGLFKISWQNSIINIIKFSLFLILGSLVPGFLLIGKLDNNHSPFFQRLFLSAVVGLTLITVVFYLMSLLKLNFLIYGYLLLNLLLLIVIARLHLASYNLKQVIKRKEFSFSISKNLNLPIVILIIAGTIFQVIPTFQSALTYPYGLGLWGPNTHDGIWHISLINQLIKGIPPETSIFAGEMLKNYHFFYDLLVAVTSFVSGISASNLIFRFYPILFSLSLGLGSYYLIKSLFYEKLSKLQFRIASTLGLYLVYFAGSFGWIAAYIKEKSFSGESAFWANQSISFNLNGPFAISLVIIIAIFQLLPKYNLKRKKLFMILCLLIGPLIAFKAYGGILILASFLIYGLLKRSLSFLYIFTVGSAISVILYLLNFTIGTKALLFSPFWFIHSMIDSPDRVGWLRLTLARESGLSGGNWFKYLSAEIIGFLIFLIGNLGVRFFALFSLLKFNKILKQNQYLFLFIFTILGFSIPIIFIQVGNPWNTIQFVYYSLYVSALVAAVIIAVFLTIVNRLVSFVILIILLVITPINSWATANTYLTQRPHAFIGNEEVQALEFLKSQNNGVVLTFPYDEKLKTKISEPWPLSVYDSTAYVSALSAKAVFLEDEPQNEILLTDFKKRKVLSKDFFAAQNEKDNEFLKSNNIKYIYLAKIYGRRLDEQTLNIENIFENDMVIIYEVR